MWKPFLLLIAVLAACQSIEGQTSATGQLAAAGDGDPYLAWQRGH